MYVCEESLSEETCQLAGGYRRQSQRSEVRAGGIRQLSLTIKTYCVPVRLRLRLRTRRGKDLFCGSAATVPKLRTDTQLAVCGNTS